MSVPGWWASLLLAAAAYRLWRLLAEDTILDRPRAALVRSEKASEWLSCPWCGGFWVALGWWAAWQAWPHGTLIVAAPFTLSAAVGALAAWLSPG